MYVPLKEAKIFVMTKKKRVRRAGGRGRQTMQGVFKGGLQGWCRLRCRAGSHQEAYKVNNY